MINKNELSKFIIENFVLKPQRDLTHPIYHIDFIFKDLEKNNLDISVKSLKQISGEEDIYYINYHIKK